MTRSSVTIQITPEPSPSTPSWMEEVAAFAQVLTHTGIRSAPKMARPSHFGNDATNSVRSRKIACRTNSYSSLNGRSHSLRGGTVKRPSLFPGLSEDSAQARFTFSFLLEADL
ncbi:hypothetical protein [Dictyobacter arantiisoli]|uniref:hypothetical protein n=1 Tax=Dictyobacter arantiisoli TaxID=2014874 RepID=UPI0011F069EA|nr:hypothetical protein [Dictyobacter arantiisoli]